MLEGKELDIKLGSIGNASADINDKGEVEIAVGIKIDLIAELEKAAAKSGNKIDDSIISALKGLLGRA